MSLIQLRRVRADATLPDALQDASRPREGLSPPVFSPLK